MNKSKKKEFKFIKKIDCNFPYSDFEACERLIDEAKNISPNAVFSILEELARIPDSSRKKVSELELKHLVQKTIANFDHPLIDLLIPTVYLMIEDKEQTVDNAISLMNEIEKHHGLWSALSLVYFSCDDENGIVDKKYNEIRDKWNINTTPQYIE